MSRSMHARCHERAHQSLGRVVLALLGALATIWRRSSRERAAGLGRELRDRTVRWFTEAGSGAQPTLGLVPETVVDCGPGSAGHQHQRCMRWISLCSARDDDSHNLAA